MGLWYNDYTLICQNIVLFLNIKHKKKIQIYNILMKYFNYDRQIQYINYENDIITNISPYFFNLKILNISNTPLYFIPKTYKLLEELDASGSYLSTLSKKLYNLKIIKVNHTNLQKIKLYPKLEYLDCSHNVLEIIELPNNSNIKYLKCNNTLIRNFDTFNYNIMFSQYSIKYYNFENLLYLNCSNTNILNLPINLPNLKYLNISNTLVKSFMYRSLLKLEVLICTNSILEILNDSLINLKILDISHNYIIHKIPNTFINLEFINIANTIKIKKLSKKFTKLLYLNCKNSMIKELPFTYNKLFYLNMINTLIKTPYHKKILYCYH
jgi:hypothetical protein